ncbi:type II and III secretion system protein family protein [Hansschlegelia zhihuaiae]|uniref:Type II and III secretion system protein family protein n=1 Tax=Hansschlegelia zhihuaiae TaxID=405005 RepID=A0A4Q0MJL0_9HYPH|nr:type II and III secretion system protein family protein [Hansschlegelia zhihuaiae]RXF73645.1 type II and III secretion system protein family protein [Hansschlegelia zhihuaiae]
MTQPDRRGVGRRLARLARLAIVGVSAFALAVPHAALAADPGYLSDAGYADGSKIELGIGKTYAVTLPRDAKEVFVADPGVANAAVRSARKAYLYGTGPGQTDVKFLDSEGKEISSYEVSVSRDVGSIRSSIARSIDGGKVRVEGVGDGVVVTGSVKSAQEAQTAIDIASGYMADPKKVVNALKIEGQDQVLLKVKVVEMKREVIKQLGVDYGFGHIDPETGFLIPAKLGGGWLIGSDGASSVGQQLASSFPFGANNAQPSGNITAGIRRGSSLYSARLQAMERAGVIKTLAEPNLTAISGESAKFLAGGQYPFPGPCEDSGNGGCTRSVEFKDFGVGLNFTPVVLSGGRISLKIATEVSELDPANGITDRGLVIPGLQVRRANSTVEVSSGGSIVMGGLIQQQTKRAVAGWPGLMRLPVLGALFRSTDYLKNETELAIFITPYLAKAVAADKLQSPDDGFAEPSDPSALLLGRLNRLYGVPGKIDPATVGRQRVGYIVD